MMLYDRADMSPTPGTKLVDLYERPVGDEVPENTFTDYRSLGELIGAFNQEAPKLGRSQVDSS